MNERSHDLPGQWNDTINVAHLESHSEVNGPGVRFCIWVQGCRKNCPGCFNPQLKPIRLAQSWSIDALFERIIATPGIEGITLSGGEPFLYARPLTQLITRLKAASQLSLFVFSGYTLAELCTSQNDAVVQLLALTDILVDGEYRREQASNRLWRGSSNQAVHFLTDRYKSLAGQLQNASGQEVEFTLMMDGSVIISGFPPRQLLQHLYPDRDTKKL
jgi:anaerobic ribonucleoside-triphosphate reductase activating protein